MSAQINQAKMEMPDQSAEALRALPIEVTWTDQADQGQLFGGRIKKVYGEFFSINLEGQSSDDLENYNQYVEPDDEYLQVPATFGGEIKYDDDGKKFLDAGTITVENNFRRNRLGERLSKAMACVAAETECKRIEISFSHPAALKIFRNIYGDDRIHYLPKYEFGEEIPINTPDEATDAIVRERQSVIAHGVHQPTSSGVLTHQPKTDEEILPGAVDGVSAWIDVEGFDTSGLEQPRNPSYSKQVAGTFLKSGEDFGKAKATAAELGALRALYLELGSDRDATLESIREDGYPHPEQITPEMVALTGVAHACGVTIPLAESRGIKGKDSTYESYTTKNRFDRFTALHIPKSLKDVWEASVKRDPNASPDVVYPEGVDNDLIHGINAPHRFFPAQTMRHLEFARLYKLDSDTEKAMGINELRDLDKCAVDWEDLVPVIESATDVTQLAGDLGATIALRLLDNGLSQEQVTGILRKGFSVEGIKKEHGNVSEADQVFNSLISALKAHPTTIGIGVALAK